MDITYLLNEVGEFTYMWGNSFLIETSMGNFIWSDPDYEGGTNKLHRFRGTYHDACRALSVPYGRDKGKHVVRAYCGDRVQLGEEYPK